MTDPAPLIHAHSLNCGYAQRPVLHEVSFSLAAGLVHGLIGANGAGKTTLLRTLAGQLQFSGELAVFGAQPFDNPAVMDRTTLAGIDAPLPDGWSARRLFAIGAARHRRWDAVRADDLLERFGVPPSTSYSRLSRGQKSALSIIYACASGTELLLLDEPYLGLDVQKRALFYEVLAEQMARPGTTIVLSTHHLHEVETLLDTVLYLDDGGVAMNGPIDDLADAVIEVAGPRGGRRPDAGASRRPAGVGAGRAVGRQPCRARSPQLSGGRRVRLRDGGSGQRPDPRRRSHPRASGARPGR